MPRSNDMIKRTSLFFNTHACGFKQNRSFDLSHASLIRMPFFFSFSHRQLQFSSLLFINMVISKILTSLGCLLILSLQLIAAAPIEALKPIAFDPTDSGNPHIDPLPFEIQAKKRVRPFHRS
ncbi:MAG: hypothetical protein BYD32DRAFT_482918 [Podila humilis]|nr:MAG: hypothetical protein BYD32DRAFT_482918 [Podila humilis]